MFDTLIVFLSFRLFFQNVNFEKSADDNKSMKNYPAFEELRLTTIFILMRIWTNKPNET